MKEFPIFSHLSHSPITRRECEENREYECKKTKCKITHESILPPEIEMCDSEWISYCIAECMDTSEYTHEDTEFLPKRHHHLEYSQSEYTGKYRYPEEYPEE
jgi:hypothetical protein